MEPVLETALKSAVRAEERANAAHDRLDNINGQIRRLGESHEKMREDFGEAMNDPEHGLRAELGNLKTEVKISALKVSAIVAAVAVVFTATTSIVVSQLLHSNNPQGVEVSRSAP